MASALPACSRCLGTHWYAELSTKLDSLTRLAVSLLACCHATMTSRSLMNGRAACACTSCTERAGHRNRPARTSTRRQSCAASSSARWKRSSTGILSKFTRSGKGKCERNSGQNRGGNNSAGGERLGEGAGRKIHHAEPGKRDAFGHTTGRSLRDGHHAGQGAAGFRRLEPGE